MGRQLGQALAAESVSPRHFPGCQTGNVATACHPGVVYDGAARKRGGTYTAVVYGADGGMSLGHAASSFGSGGISRTVPGASATRGSSTRFQAKSAR